MNKTFSSLQIFAKPKFTFFMSVPDKGWSLGLGNILDIPTIMFLYFYFIKWIKVLYKLKFPPGSLFNTLFVPTWTITWVYLLSLIMLYQILWINSPIVSPLCDNISASLIPVKYLPIESTNMSTLLLLPKMI